MGLVKIAYWDNQHESHISGGAKIGAGVGIGGGALLGGAAALVLNHSMGPVPKKLLAALPVAGAIRYGLIGAGLGAGVGALVRTKKKKGK